MAVMCELKWVFVLPQFAHLRNKLDLGFAGFLFDKWERLYLLFLLQIVKVI